jgi:hypothetical protein
MRGLRRKCCPQRFRGTTRCALGGELGRELLIDVFQSMRDYFDIGGDG